MSNVYQKPYFKPDWINQLDKMKIEIIIIIIS